MVGDFYPNEWHELSLLIREANHWTCQACQRQCRRPGEFYLGWEYELSTAHICQGYEAESVFLAALCGSCHFQHDAPYSWVARLRRRRWQQRAAGQLELAYP